MVSFRLGGPDGVSIAGDGPVDRRIPGLAVGAGVAGPGHPPPVDQGELADALAGADLVVVENICSLPLNPPAAAALAGLLRGRRAVMHHHDLPWQRARFAGCP